MFKAKAGLIHFVVGQINDYYATKSRIYTYFDEILEQLLIEQEHYENIYIFRENIDHLSLVCQDHEKECQILGLRKRQESMNEFDVLLEVNEELPELTIGKDIDERNHHYSFDRLMEKHLIPILRQKKHKSAILFPYGIVHYLTHTSEKVLKTLQNLVDTDNIMIFMFHNIGELDEFSKTYKNLISEYYFIQHDHQDIIMLENEYKKVLQDRLLLLNPLGVDEIENLLSYRLMDYYLDHPRIIDENSEDINKIAIMIKNDMSISDPLHRTISFMNYHTQMPLYTIQESIFNEDIEQHLLEFQYLLEQEKTKEENKEMVGIDEVNAHIEKLQRSYQRIKHHQQESYETCLFRLNNMKSDIDLPEYLKYMMNMILLGNPGVGKTTVARNYGYKLKNLNLIKDGHVVEASKTSLKGEYVGQSAAKTNQKIKEAEGGIFFIDEIYSFAKEGEQGSHAGYEQEIINTILVAMTDPHIHVVFVVAGYEKESMDVIHSYKGLESRFGTKIVLKDYHAKQLHDIMIKKLKEDHISIDEKIDLELMIRHWMYDYYMNSQEQWANVRTFQTRFYGQITDYMDEKNKICIENLPNSFINYLQSDEMLYQEVITSLKQYVDEETLINILGFMDYCHLPHHFSRLLIQGKKGYSQKEIIDHIIKMMCLLHIIDYPKYTYVTQTHQHIDEDTRVIIIDHVEDIQLIIQQYPHCYIIYLADEQLSPSIKMMFPYNIIIPQYSIKQMVEKTIKQLQEIKIDENFQDALYQYYQSHQSIDNKELMNYTIQKLLQRFIIKKYKNQQLILTQEDIQRLEDDYGN